MDWQDGLKFLDKLVLGIIVGATLYFNSNVTIWREYIGTPKASDSTVFRTVPFNGQAKIFC